MFFNKIKIRFHHSKESGKLALDEMESRMNP